MEIKFKASFNWALDLQSFIFGEIFSASMCVFNGFFMRFGTRFQSRFFARKDTSWRVRKPNAKQNRFQIVTIFFLLFSSAYFLDIMSHMFPQVLAKYFYGRIQRGVRGSGTPLKNHKK